MVLSIQSIGIPAVRPSDTEQTDSPIFSNKKEDRVTPSVAAPGDTTLSDATQTDGPDHAHGHSETIPGSFTQQCSAANNLQCSEISRRDV